MDWKTKTQKNLTENWDESVTGSIAWSLDSKMIYFTTAFHGTKQLFSLNPNNKKITQLTQGNFDVNDIFAQNKLLNRKEYGRFIKEGDFSLNRIKLFAKNQNVLPCIVIGRLQSEAYLKWSDFREETVMYSYEY